MPTYYGSTGNYPNNPEDYISVPNPGLVNPGPVTTDNTVIGTAGDDNLTGTSGNDRLDGGAGNDLLYGGLGDDSYYVTVGDQVADDGGIDTIYFGGSGFWRLAPNFENIVATGTGPTDFRGNNDANVMIGNDAENYFNGRAGDDTMIGLGGDDHFDMSTGRPGDATGGIWTMGNRLIDGGDGVDTIDYDGYERSAVTIDLGAGTASGGGDLGLGSATLISIENAVGGQYDDRITGSAAANHLFGRGGNDTVDYDGYARGAVTIDLAAGTASGGGDLGVGAATLVSIERAVGGAFNDQITGSSAANELFGRGGNDTLVGGAGDDTLWGGVG